MYTRMKLYIASVLILLQIYPSPFIAQKKAPQFEKVDISINTIPFNQVVEIIQDSAGYMWFSTTYEVLKYDGHKAQLYRYNSRDSTSLASNTIAEMFLDSKGRLWLGHIKGMSRYIKDCDCFKNYLFNSSPKDSLVESLFKSRVINFTKNTVFAIAEDRNHQIWAGTNGGDLARYDEEADLFHLSDDLPSRPAQKVPPLINELMVDRNNNLWIGSGSQRDKDLGSLIKLNLDAGDIKEYKNREGDVNSLIDNRVTKLLENTDGTILVGTFNSGLHYYNAIEDNFIRLTYNPKEPNALHAPPNTNMINGDYPAVSILFQDMHKGYWIGVPHAGLYHFDMDKGTLDKYIYSKLEESEFINNLFYGFHEDRQGIIWLGMSQNGGVFKKDSYEKNFSFYPKLKQGQRSAQSIKDDNIFWLGSIGEGLHRLDIITGDTKAYLHDANDPNTIGSNFVRAIHADNDGFLWLGVGDGGYGGNESGKGGLDRFNPRTEEFQHFFIEHKSRPDFNLTVFSIYEDKKGRLWFDTGPGGIFRSDESKQTFEHFNFKGIDDAELWVIREPNYNNLWVTDFTNSIIYRFDQENETFDTILSGYAVEGMLEEEGGYWFPTIGSGLIYLDKRTDSLIHYSVLDGLPSDEVLEIYPGGKQEYWISTRKGLTKLDASIGTFYNAGMPKGLFHPTGLRARDGKIFFASNSGLYSFYTDEVEGNPIPPQLVINHLFFSGEQINLQEDEKGNLKEIKLNYLQNDLSIEFAGIHFSDPSKNLYSYKLEPLDKEWSEEGTSRNVRYPNLKPGQYNFHIRTSNRDGIWTDQSMNIPFRIYQAWWKSWWFILIGIFLSLILIYWFYNFQLSKKLAVQESLRLRDMNKLKTNLYNNITHEFRTPLTVILGMTQTIKEKTTESGHSIYLNSVQLIERNAKTLLKLINEMLSLSKIDSGNLVLNLQQSDIILFIKYVAESFHSLAASRGIHLNIVSGQDSLLMDFDHDKIETIISNLMSNAIKFSHERGNINVHLSSLLDRGQPYFSILIRDNGIGMKAEAIEHIFDRFYQAEGSSVRRHMGTGIGLALTKELVELMKGSINASSKPGKGSTFEILLTIERNMGITSVTFPERKENIVVDILFDEKEAEKNINAELPLILVIEDQEDVAQYISLCLESNYQIIRAANGLIGINTAIEMIPDLIISDVMMPEKDGFEVCATLKSDERTNHIPIILLTARFTVEDRLEGITQGADAYLAKPFEKKELQLRVHNLLEVRKVLREKYGSEFFEKEKKDNIPIDEDPFINKIRNLVIENIEDENFSIQDLEKNLYLSRSQIHRKIKAVTGMSTNIFVRSIRLHEARSLLHSSHLSISEVSYSVGFKSPVYFSQAYKETFGESPSESRTIN